MARGSDRRRLRVLARQVMIGDRFRQLQVVSVDNGNVILEPFERETAATLFVDAPLAVLKKERADDLLIDILNSIDSFDALVKFLRESGVCIPHDGMPGVLIRLEVGKCSVLSGSFC